MNVNPTGKSPPTTRGGLEPAVIRNLATGSADDTVHCMFNPQEYTLSKANEYSAKPAKGKDLPAIIFAKAGAETLRLQLFFDTYADQTDVRVHTDKLWKMMRVCEERTNASTNKGEPPHVLFSWGHFEFEAVITDITQKFTLFSDKGIPLRTTVDVTFQQITDSYAHHSPQNPTSGGGPAMRTYTVRAGDRLDLIAYQVYEDATQWRPIAQANGILEPHCLREGQRLIIPPLA
ncbi:MAG TPA: LysM peptidoglycan-binding domain-containing protein [Anaerolineae bacterium]|nr:LysM peptidoglycan-binding domain-containing protein [Anaerolineae bacterium]HPL29920.1 LysM peptidoglycan-binding domain-containing protein [Anaerolineae bacterium]